MDLTQYKVVDFFTNTTLRVRTLDELEDWLVEKQATKTDEFYRQIELLRGALESGQDYQWYAAALYLTIIKKKTRRKTK